MSRKRVTQEPKDYGTAELARQFTVVPKLSGINTYSAKVMDETEIDRLLLRDVITPEEHGILEMFMVKLHKMGFVGVKSPDYSSPVFADATAVGDKRAMSIRGMVRVIAALDERIGRKHRTSLVDLVLQDVPWPLKDEELKDSVAALRLIIS